MAVYLISYDIAEKDAFEYDGLWAELKRLGAVRVLYSEWIVSSTTMSATDVYNALAPKTQSKDRLLVVELANSASWDKLLITDQAFKALMAKAG